LDFSNSIDKLRLNKEFGSERAVLSTKQRPHTSLSMIQRISKEIGINQGTMQKYGNLKRYVIARDITYDLFISVYDVNSHSAIVLRPSQAIDNKEETKIRSFVRSLKKPNLEIRGIGLQNGDMELLEEINKVKEICKGPIVELDVFGNETRHIALDLKTGMTYNILLLDRIYRPGELVTTLGKNDFEAKKSKISFV